MFICATLCRVLTEGMINFDCTRHCSPRREKNTNMVRYCRFAVLNPSLTSVFINCTFRYIVDGANGRWKNCTTPGYKLSLINRSGRDITLRRSVNDQCHSFGPIDVYLDSETCEIRSCTTLLSIHVVVPDHIFTLTSV